MPSFLRLASLSAFWLAFCFTAPQVPLMGQSTPEGPRQADSRQLSGDSFDGALRQLRQMLETSLQDSLNLKAEAEDLRIGLENWQAEAIKLSSMLTASRKDSEALSNSLTDSLKREADLQAATQARAMLDAKSIAEARGQRDLWMWGAAACAAIGVIGWVM